jgi:lambda repressor-like predicted transcriptional regulator
MTTQHHLIKTTNQEGTMHPADIKAALEKANTSQIQIARELKVSDTAVNHVIYGRATSRRIASLISKKTGLPLSVLWPGRYENHAA